MQHCKDMVAIQVTSINRVSRVNINIPERTMNVAYDSRITDAYIIQMTLPKTGYKTVEEPGIFTKCLAVLKNLNRRQIRWKLL
jgi:copper chaperone CopZ